MWNPSFCISGACEFSVKPAGRKLFDLVAMQLHKNVLECTNKYIIFE